MSKREQYYVIQEQFKGLFLNLTDEDAGLLMTALSDYHFYEKEPQDLPGRLLGMFDVLKIVTHNDFKL